MSQQEKLNLTPELNSSDRNLLLCEEGILKGVISNILRSKYGEFTFGSFLGPIGTGVGRFLGQAAGESFYQGTDVGEGRYA